MLKDIHIDAALKYISPRLPYAVVWEDLLEWGGGGNRYLGMVQFRGVQGAWFQESWLFYNSLVQFTEILVHHGSFGMPQSLKY